MRITTFAFKTIAVKIRLQDTKNGPARRPPKTRQNRAAEKTFFKTCQKPSKFVKNDLRSMLLVGRHQKPDFRVKKSGFTFFETRQKLSKPIKSRRKVQNDHRQKRSLQNLSRASSFK